MLGAIGRKIQKAHRAKLTPHGKQSVKKLMAHGAATSSIELSGDTKLFDRVARKWNVDYSFHKAGPDKYLLLLQAHSSYVCVDPKGGVLAQVGSFLQRQGYRIKVFNSIDFSKPMYYNPLSYIKNEADILKFVNTLIANTRGDGKEADSFWTKAETLLYCALLAYIIFEGPEEDRNINTLVDMISGMEVKEDDESYMNAVDYMFKGLQKRKPDCFAVKQYVKYRLASGKTAKSIFISCGARLAAFDIPNCGRS